MPTAISLIPKNGAVSYGSFVADYNAFEITANQSVESVTPYGANTCSKNVGNGTPDFDFSISAFALAHAASTPAALPSMSASGVTTTFTLDTGVTEACSMVASRISLGHGRMRAAVPYNITGKNGGDVTETWAVT
jgi:hypothetical protein